MALVNAVLSTLLVLGLLASALGYRHSLKRFEHSPEWFFSAAKVLIALAFGARLLFWDVVWNTIREVDRGTAVAMSDAVGGTSINIVFTLIGLAGVYCSLKARQLLLREEEQKHWPWIIAWAHPSILGIGPRRSDRSA